MKNVDPTGQGIILLHFGESQELFAGIAPPRKPAQTAIYCSSPQSFRHASMPNFRRKEKEQYDIIYLRLGLLSIWKHCSPILTAHSFSCHDGFNSLHTGDGPVEKG